LFEEEQGSLHGDLLNLSIVAVEDDREARDVLVLILQDRGARVFAAANYDQALQVLEATKADVLISDIGMAGKDGYDLIREVRRREQGGTRRLPAIAVTAFARPRDRALAFEAGFDAHCAKPLQTAELVSAVRRLTSRASGLSH
jgi:CheY-like chemotaxis protein